MSALVRFALRLAAIEVLQADPVIAAATGGRVFDSEMADIDPDLLLPVIIVHTESQSGEGWSENNGGPPFRGAVSIVFEIAHVAKADQDGEPVLFRPETTRELEAALDLLEWRIIEAIAFSETNLAKMLRSKVLKRIRAMSSERFASDDIGTRVAARLLTLTVEIFDTEGEVFHPDDELPAGPYRTLPEPLRSFAPHFASGSSARAALDLVAGQLPEPAASDAFDQTDTTEFEYSTFPAGTRPPP